ncbi:hypothetical protein FJTKL_15368 [Diaporthe vaccinii]|uniref:Uncharacterized protein n=1 Tax=Diaporthe vaccinii TaxID=105482 RepID=A0ABR4E524_9PEZI
MPQRQKRTYEDYPSPETVDSSSACGVHGPSPNSSFGSPGDKAARGHGRGDDRGDDRGDGDGELDSTEVRTCTQEEEPQVYQAVELVRARAYGEHSNNELADWIELEITPPQYHKFLQTLEDDQDQRLSTYFTDKIRHDYDPRRCILVLRMPSSVHDVFQAFLLSKITSWIERVQEKVTPRLAKEIIQQITPALTTDFSIKLRSAVAAERSVEAAVSKKERSTHSPDGQYHYPGSRYPVFVVEIGFSQTGQDLEELAKHYYEETDGYIKTVLTVGLGYLSKAQRRLEHKRTGRRTTRSSLHEEKPTTKQASFSLYRGPKRIICNRIFRNEAGELVQSEGLTLHISDLVPDVVLERLSEDLRKTDSNVDRGLDLSGPEYALHITAQELFNMLARTGVVQRDRDKTDTPSPKPQSQSQKRRVEWAPQEDDDENGKQDEDDRDGKSPSRKTSALASSKRRKLSRDRVYSSSSRPSTAVSVRTRSQSRGSC